MVHEFMKPPKIAHLSVVAVALLFGGVRFLF